MQHLHWRQLVGVAYTEDEAKALAAETEVGASAAALKAPGCARPCTRAPWQARSMCTMPCGPPAPGWTTRR